MRQPKHPILRIVVPVLFLALAVVVGWAVMKNTGRVNTPAPTPAPASAQTTPPAPAPQTPATTPATAATPTKPATDVPVQPVASGTPSARVWPVEPASTTLAPIGSLDPASLSMMQVEFSADGAGVRSIRLSRHLDGATASTNAEIQHAEPNLVPMAALGVYVNGTFVNLVGSAAAPVWRQGATPGQFEAEIVDGSGAPMLRVERRYQLQPDSFRIDLHQSVKNLTAAPVSVSWMQLGPIDLPGEASAYGGDKRRIRFGYLLDPTADPTRRGVVSNEFMQDHGAALGSADKTTGAYPPKLPLWPNAKATAGNYELMWTALTNRYFGVAIQPIADPAAGALKPLPFNTVDRMVLNRYKTDASGKQTPDPVIALRLSSAPVTLAPGAAADLSVGIYAGPASRPELRADPVTHAYGLDGLVVFNFGGPCGFCTFDFITAGLFWLLHFLHDYLVRDWALAIILLVVCVRTVLHPLTKWSQVRMQRFAKQMQGMGPKQKQIQERYGDDKKKLQEEMAKLWREEGVSPMGALGCLPMFLMTPVWIALYAMLYFTFELRHQPAFFGLFQRLSNGWTFLADLAEPDRVYYFGRVIANIPMLGPIQSINILPLILGAVFFVHQKYLTPPTTTPLTPEQEMQQKMVKVMSVVMFPLLMYNAPSGLAIYFIANSTLAIFENKYIRAHIDKHDLLNTKNAKGSKGSGFMGRLMSMAEERAKMVERSRAGKGQGKSGR